MSLYRSDWMLSMYLSSFKKREKLSASWEGRYEYMKQGIEDQCVEAVIEKAAKRSYFISGLRCGKTRRSTEYVAITLAKRGGE